MAETALAWLEVSCLVGLLYAPVSLGLAWSFRVLNYPDLTCEGSFMVGGAVSVAVLNNTGSVLLSILAGVIAGGAAGCLTACVHVYLRVSRLLSGVVVWAVLYSITLRILGGLSNVVADPATMFGSLATGQSKGVEMVTALAASTAMASLVIAAGRARWGRVMRAFGDQPWFTSSLGLSPSTLVFAGLGMANALIGAGGVLVCHFRHVCDVNMSAGVLVSGLAAVVIGEAVFEAKRMWQHAVAAVCGTIIYNMAVGVFYFDWGIGLEKFLVASDVRLVSGLMLLFPAALVARKRRRYRLFASEW